MNDSKNLILRAQNQDGDSLALSLAPDTDMSGLVDAFRTIAFWLTFSPTTIDENIPDGLREWSYDDEKVEPPAVSEEEIAELRKRDPMIEADEQLSDSLKLGLSVEEAMVPAIELLENHYAQEFLVNGDDSAHAKSYKAALAVIKASLQPKKVPMEWVDKWAKKIDRLYVGNRNMVLWMLEELGIAVADGEC